MTARRAALLAVKTREPARDAETPGTRKRPGRGNARDAETPGTQ
jgi:hypothetical protein